MEINITWNICRVCLVEEEMKTQTADLVEPMHHIYNDEMLANQIFVCSGITMKPNDSLPEKICKKCLTMVKHAVNFRNICRASDTYLQSVLQRTKSARALFKPEQIFANLSEELNDNKEAKEDDASIVKGIKYMGKILDKKPRKLRRDIKSVKTHSKKALLRPENADHISEQDLDNIDYSSPNEMTYSFVSNIKKGVKEYEEDKINEKLEHSPLRGFQTNDTCSENDDFDENHETGLNNLSTNIDANPRKNNKNVYISATKVEQNVDDEYRIESYQQDENSQISNLESVSSQEILNHLVSDVSSTVMTKEFDIEIDEENCSLVSETNDDMQTEYIVDEYLIDASSSDVSIRKSTVLRFDSSMMRKHANKMKKHGVSTNHSAISSSSLKAVSESHEVWICDLCGNHFTSRQLLQGHMKIHRQEKKHECEICSKRFITACNLQAHMRVHTGEKPFECQYCGRRFSDRSSNLRHERTHTNEKPFQCNDCGKAFSLSTTLKKHLKVHTGERSHKCDICMKSFKLPHQLKAHKNSSIHKQ